jgi:heat shock protein HtpX
MSNLYAESDKNIRRTWILIGTFFLVVIGLGWLFSRIYESPGILFFAIIFAIIMNVTSYWYSDKIVLALHKAKPATRESHYDLWNSVENLSITAGLPMPRLYIVDDSAPNAFATGRNKEHAVVCVTTGLLHILDKNELEGVLAHELSHIGNRDILVSTVAVVLAGFVAMLSDFFIRSSMFGGRDRDNRSSGGAWMLIGIVLAILSPIAATLIQLAISRKREFLADASGALLTRYPEGLASALKKIHADGNPLKTAHTSTAHLFISNPFGTSKTSQLIKLFQTHPPVEERVKALIGEIR